jgi:hypothetical protein
VVVLCLWCTPAGTRTHQPTVCGVLMKAHLADLSGTTAVSLTIGLDSNSAAEFIMIANVQQLPCPPSAPESSALAALNAAAGLAGKIFDVALPEQRAVR